VNEYNQLLIRVVATGHNSCMWLVWLKLVAYLLPYSVVNKDDYIRTIHLSKLSANYCSP